MNHQQSTHGHGDLQGRPTERPEPARPEHPVRGLSEAVVIHEPGQSTAHAAASDVSSHRTPPVIEVESLGQVHPGEARSSEGPASYAPWSHPAPHPYPATSHASAPASIDPLPAPGAAQPYGAVQPYAPQVQSPVVPYQPYPGVQQMPTVIVMQQPKSVGISLVLTFFFGPLGMLYSTVTGFVVMFLINLVVLPLTLGIGAVLTWPACMVWGAVAASNHNTRIAMTAHAATQGAPM